MAVALIASHKSYRASLIGGLNVFGSLGGVAGVLNMCALPKV